MRTCQERKRTASRAANALAVCRYPRAQKPFRMGCRKDRAPGRETVATAMLQSWFVIAAALGYIGLSVRCRELWRPRQPQRSRRDGRWRHLIYPLTLAIYCTSWTFFGSVGLATRTGFEFLTIYIGPILMIGPLSPLVMRIVRLAKAQNIDIDRGLHRRALRQASGGGGDRRDHRDHRLDPLHRAATQGGVGFARRDAGANLGWRPARRTAAWRHGAVRRARDGCLHDAVRHAPCRRHRAPGWPDAGDRGRVR